MDSAQGDDAADMTDGEKRFRILVENTADAFFLHDKNGRFIDVNQQACASLGYCRDELLKMSVFDVEKKATPEQLNKIWPALYKGDRVRIEGTHQRKDGSTFPVEINLGLLEKDGENYLLAFAHDLSEQRQVENYLKESEKQQIRLLSLSPAVIYACEPDGDYTATFISENVRPLFGYSPHDFLNDPGFWVNGVHPEDLVRVLDGMSDLFEHGQYSHEYRFRLPDGHYVWVRDDLRLVYNDDGSPEEIVGSWLIIDEQKRSQNKLDKSSYINNLLASYIGLTAGLSVGEVSHKTLNFLREQLAIRHATIALCEDDCTGFRFFDVNSEFKTGIHQGGYVSSEETVLSEVVKHREALYRPDITALDSGYTLDKNLVAAGIKSSFLVPLWVEGQCVGSLNLGSGCINGFSEQQREFISLLAPGLAQALHNTVLFSLLKESEERYRALIDATNDLVQSVGPDGRFIFVNKAWLDVMGYSQEEVSGLTVWDIIHESSIEHCQKLFRQIMAGENGWGVGATFRTKEGGAIDVEGNIVARFKDGELIGTQGIFQDVSKRRLAEKSLQASDEMLRLVLSSIPVRVFWKDRDSTYLGCNNLFSKDAGLEYPEQIIGKTDYELAWKEQADFYREDDQSVMQTVQSKLGYEEPQTTPDGSRIWIKTSKVPLADAAGSVIGIMGTYEDITEKKLAEEKLRLSATVVDNTAEAILITDAGSNIVAVNRAFTEITGFTEKEVLGKNPRIMKSEKHNRDFYMTLWSSIDNAGFWRGEIWNRRKNGEIFPAWSNISVVRDEQGGVANYVSVFSDISSVKRSQEKLDFLSSHDALTGLPNRLVLNDRIDQAIQRAQRDSGKVAVLFIDLDRFKNINDSLGHIVGDTVLQEVAKRIKQLVRLVDTVGRLGGDEFIILVEGLAGVQDVAVYATKMLEIFHAPFVVEDHELHLSISMGISLYPGDGDNAAALIKNADAAMYRTKEEGRNDYQFCTAALTTEVFERLTLETALRHALVNDELVLYYQPQYLLKSGALSGSEALIRWLHPEMGLISPAKFIPLAEESGLIIPIGEWVLHAACVQMKKWSTAGLPVQRVAVNVSSRQFQRSNFVKIVKSTLQKTGLEPRYLELEITESMLMHEPAHAVKVLEELKSFGISIAIDDFGTGYSSLSYLKQLPVDKLKIDRSFVRDIPHDSNDEAITKAIIAMAHSLNLEVLAEGVETEEQLSFLKSQGCNECQGFLFSRPVPAEEFEKLVK